MTDTRLRERLLELAAIIENENGRGHEIAPILLREAVAALDAKDAEPKRATDALATCRELREYDRKEIEKLRKDRDYWFHRYEETTRSIAALTKEAG